jgi:tetratricopeptide (TPR) repeat protein
MSNLGFLLQQAYSAHTQGRFAEAIVHYRQVLAQDPAHAEASYGLGLALYDLARYPEARARFQAAADRKPSFPDAHYGLALAEKALGNYEQAFSHLHDAQRLRPDFIDAIATEADLLERVGRKQEAYDLLAGLVDRGLVNTNLAVGFAKIARHFGQEQRAVEVLRRALDVPGLALSHRRELHFELGSRLDTLHRYDEAFPHFAEANRLKGAVYDHARQVSITDDLIRAFGTTGFPGYARATNVSELPVFIVGMPRSGTSLVESVLASHPAVFGAGELDFMALFTRFAQPKLGGARSVAEVMRRIDAGMADLIANEYLALLRRLGGDSVTRVTDKLPYNFYRLGMFSLLFPRARIIHCVRNPRDTCLSIYFQHFTGAHDYAYDLRNIGRYYREYRRLMNHWREVGTLPMLEVQYETLVQSPETQLPRIVEFCGLPWDDACSRFHATERVTKTASYDQVRRPLYSSAMGRWRHYERHLSPLVESLADNDAST